MDLINLEIDKIVANCIKIERAKKTRATSPMSESRALRVCSMLILLEPFMVRMAGVEPARAFLCPPASQAGTSANSVTSAIPSPRYIYSTVGACSFRNFSTGFFR